MKAELSIDRQGQRDGETGAAALERHARGQSPRCGSVYKDVRSLSRGLTIIEALGVLGWIKLGKLSAYTGIDRTTVYRLASTLEEDGYVVRRLEDGAVGLSGKLLNISQNLRSNDLVARIVINHLSELTRQIKWPSDFGVFSQGELRIAASTHSQSPMSFHRAMIGNTRPLFRSALGKAYLAALPDEELSEILALVQSREGADAADAHATEAVRRSLNEVRERGYSFAIGTTELKFSAIALPVRQSESVVGAVNIIFFRRALTPGVAAEKYLPKMKRTVTAIEQDLVDAMV